MSEILYDHLIVVRGGCVKKTGKQLSVTVDGKSFGYRDESLPEDYFVGITGCEGINRFFDIKIEKP
ncbi:MAG: hypothetical protein ACOYMV_07165 [Verrucomicrobiia bacterium]